LLAGLQRPSRGLYKINNTSVTDLTFDEFVPYRMSIGYGFDFGGLLANRTLTENLTLPLLYHRMFSEAEALERAHWYLHHLGGYKQRDQRPAFVPGGLRKLVCLIRAVITQPQLLLLDDPSVGLSEETFSKFIEVMKTLKDQGYLKHVFISSFDDKAITQLKPLEIFIDDKKILNSKRRDAA
jgi:ABC-type transporter Mla maintaining outer membrane lipid asymmetry ATPase subunit MlaF